MSAKLRHIAISVPDVAAAQIFFEQAFGMTKAGDAGRGVYMTDGVMNVALLDFEDNPLPGVETGTEHFYGLYHFGMWVDDLEAAETQVKDAGAEFVRGRRPDEPDRFYEVKYRSPDGLIFDITTSGWVGAVRDPGSTEQP
jgi:lactoylglutathione lyase